MMEYRKNHYIPEFYLQHFTNIKNHFYVFDKLNPHVNSNFYYKSPSQICFEMDRNTLFNKTRDRNDTLERVIYNHFDGLHQETIKQLVESDKDEFRWTEKNMTDICLFIPLLFWRSPVSDNILDLKIQKAKSLKDISSLVMSYSKSGEIIEDKSFHREVLDDKNMRKAIRHILAISTYSKPKEIYDNLEWRVIYQNNDNSNLTSDNPIIFREFPIDNEDFRSSHIIPLSRNKALVRINIKYDKQFVHLPYLQDLAIIHQAHRYVICADEDHLKDMLKEYEVHKKHGQLKYLIKDLFECYE
jgi:uncharacterized protein DUF4238